jgi:hypothetical protein
VIVIARIGGIIRGCIGRHIFLRRYSAFARRDSAESADGLQSEQKPSK